MPTPMPMPNMPQPSAVPVSSAPLGLKNPERRHIIRPVAVVGVKGAYLSAMKKVVKRMLRGGASRSWTLKATAFSTPAKFADWLESNEDMRAELGSGAKKHGVADGVYVAVGKVYVRTADIWAECGSKLNKKSQARLSDAILKAMHDSGGGGPTRSFAPSVGIDGDTGGAPELNPKSTYYKVGIIVLAMLVILFGGFELAIRRRDARLEWIGIPAPLEATRLRVRAFYREHNPERLEHKYSRKLEKLIQKYEGNEKELFEKLRSKYADTMKQNEADGEAGSADGETGHKTEI